MSVIRKGLLLTALMISPALAEEIAILLPQTGPAAKAGTAVRDGLLAGYYQTGGAGNASLVLNFRDSGSGGQVYPLLENLITPATRLLIGPLLREQAAEILSKPPAIPVLALNRVPGLETPGVWQFALSPDDEIPPLANLLKQEGVQRVRILMQADEGSERLRQTFEKIWTTKGGTLLPAFTLQESSQGGISASLRQMLADPSTTKAQALFLATPALAVQVLPLLAFYQKQPLPVYSLSPAFDEMAPELQRRDLNGLRLCGLAWSMENRWPEQPMLAAASPPESGSFNRLHAFGADAWTLQRLLPLRKPVTQSLRTGIIALDERQLTRIPACMEIQDGTLRPYTPVFRPGR